MEIKKISEKFSVSAQIAATDLPAIKAAGIKAIICNRPDGEEDAQVSFAQIEQAAKAAGIKAYYAPVVPGMIEEKDIADFGAALADLPSPVLAYCRTGTRSATLWSFHEASSTAMSEILAATKAAGYDMSGVAHQIANLAKTPTSAC